MMASDLEKTCEIAIEDLRKELSKSLGSPITPQVVACVQTQTYAILERLSNELRITPPNVTVTQDPTDPSKLIIGVPREFFDKLNAITVYTTEMENSGGDE